MRKENIEAKKTHLGHAWLEKKKKQQAIERKDCSNKHWLAKHMHPSFSIL
jgi:IS1 family transposase